MTKWASRIQRILCKIGWHSWSYDPIVLDGPNQHSRCKWCRYEGIVDSQGNLF